jgi:DNA replicative helicase MCM subunit Mcm2 (Cdc46/Mcm family)
MSDFDDLLKIQRMMQERARQEIEQDRTVELHALVGSLVPEKKKVQLEKIYYVASLKGFSEAQVNEVLKKYIRDGMMFQPQVGYIQRE